MVRNRAGMSQRLQQTSKKCASTQHQVWKVRCERQEMPALLRTIVSNHKDSSPTVSTSETTAVQDPLQQVCRNSAGIPKQHGNFASILSMANCSCCLGMPALLRHTCCKRSCTAVVSEVYQVTDPESLPCLPV